jgi:hypothetical protein
LVITIVRSPRSLVTPIICDPEARAAYAGKKTGQTKTQLSTIRSESRPERVERSEREVRERASGKKLACHPRASGVCVSVCERESGRGRERQRERERGGGGGGAS